MQLGTVYLIPTVLFEDELHCIPDYVVDTIKNCEIFFTENEKTTRRFFKKLWKEMVIDNYQWHTIHKTEQAVVTTFLQHLKDGKNVGIVSEAGCPGIADPGQILVEAAQQINAIIKPLVGPSSILLALMASGMNGQCFKFNGYLPIDAMERKKKIKALEMESLQQNCTQIFIETPYRNNQLINDVLSICNKQTKFCIAVNITSAAEKISTKSIESWKKNIPDIHKQPAIYLLNAF
ncbi:MAG TPA: SAM-dependent methyltransferase [Chitinophagaceae bacterium]|nr:SAM-dependent methyltransferase [Chitinophagaceae bacterium]MCC6634262.1 SAM-dependent methyltransferase [Chitinophagaceae bacterium]HMZ46010.1 SAM-dependent methyltransferase [Chitinophagaceae bacterium]HNM34374.1 SAM-dependent methyltransferase [Chitinophagaceae bacterium]HNN30837.1 SAM-dependent methyltransferase [Chitinophagaceae bacterium]